MNDQERKEECRREVRHYLAQRPGIAMKADAICRGVRQYPQEMVDDALELLRGLDQVQWEVNSLGATRYYKITSAGVLADERGQ